MQDAMDGAFTVMAVSFYGECFIYVLLFSHRTILGNKNRLENGDGYGLAFDEEKGFYMSATLDEFLDMMIVNHKDSNMFLLSPDSGRNCLTHKDDSFSLSSCSGTGSFVSMQLSFLSEEKETLEHQKRKLFHTLASAMPSKRPSVMPSAVPTGSAMPTKSVIPSAMPTKSAMPTESAMPTKQTTHLLTNLEGIIGGVMIDFEDVWKNVTLVEHPSSSPSMSPSVFSSSAPSDNPSDMPSQFPSTEPTTVPSLSLVPSMKPSESPTLSPCPLISVNLNFRLLLDLCAYDGKEIKFGLEQSLTDYLRRNPIPLSALEGFYVEKVEVLNNCTEVRLAYPYVPQHIIYTRVTAGRISCLPVSNPSLDPTSVPSITVFPSTIPTSDPSEFPSEFPTTKPSSKPSEAPTSVPSVDSSPPTISLQPSQAPTQCIDSPGFKDSYGDNCTWYEERLDNANQCPFYGQYWANEEGVTADMACCYW